MYRTPAPRPGCAVQRGIRKPVITFDAGQTLVELDLDFLAGRLAERGVTVDPIALGAALPAAWSRYDVLVAQGARHPWHALMTLLLEHAGITEPAAHVEWLWTEQPRANLWRRPMPEMLDLARELAARGAIVGVLSNSEGKLAELFDEIGIAAPFASIIDSGRVGLEKPDPRIFEHTLATLGAPGAAAIHIGDSWAADIVGALGAGWRAIWFGRNVTAVDDERVAVARDAAEVRAALVRWGAL
ncbi:MAG: HAD family hydrolase [Deltaproteobacteria bacterium]|nr:HAD family hydrolase [Deltaproteobacteria bacterium]